MAITDLTNTTWKYTVTSVISPGTVTHTGAYSVNGTINGVSFDTLQSSVRRGSYDDGIAFNDIILFPDGVSFTGSIGDEYIISFTDGTDIKNPELIAWLTEYGELQEEKITDLTGYTVTVPAGWSAEAGYGQFEINYGLSTSYSSLCIGYQDNTTASNRITQYYSDGTLAYVLLNNTGFKLFNISGNDASKPSLIQWFVDNNAIFEKTGGEEEPDTPETPTTPHGEIYYKGNLVATIVEGETIVLHTKDFKFLGDIVIKNVLRNLISFTIGGETYYAIDGMTWAEWVESEYDPVVESDIKKFLKYRDMYIHYYKTPSRQVANNDVSVVPNEKIMASVNYTMIYVPEGSN